MKNQKAFPSVEKMESLQLHHSQSKNDNNFVNVKDLIENKYETKKQKQTGVESIGRNNGWTANTEYTKQIDNTNQLLNIQDNMELDEYIEDQDLRMKKHHLLLDDYAS